MANPIVIGGILKASGTGAIGVSVSGACAISHIDLIEATTSINLNTGSVCSAYGCEFDPRTISGGGVLESLPGDRSAWDTIDYPIQHASDIDDLSYIYHNDPNNPPLGSDLGPGSFYIGGPGGVAVATGMSGDATLDSAGVLTITAQAVDASNIAMTNGSIFIGGADGAAHEQAISGDASISNAGVLTLATVNTDVGTYGDSANLTQITVDAKGRITAIGEIAFTSDGGTPQVYNEVQIADGISLTYHLMNYANPGTIRVYKDGIRLPAADDAAVTDEVIFDSAPALDAVLVFDYELETA